VAVGDNASGSNAQNLGNLHGKILRLNPGGSIPPDNPICTNGADRNCAIWSYGLRNPFTFSVQPETGRILINDVGQNTWEEINDGLPAANYGWPDVEGPTPPGVAGRTYPLLCYAQSGGTTLTGCGIGTSGINGCAITGGTFVDPGTSAFPAGFDGDYFFSDYCGGWIRQLDVAADSAADFASAISEPIDLAFAGTGSSIIWAAAEAARHRDSFAASSTPLPKRRWSRPIPRARRFPKAARPRLLWALPAHPHSRTSGVATASTSPAPLRIPTCFHPFRQATIRLASVAESRMASAPT